MFKIKCREPTTRCIILQCYCTALLTKSSLQRVSLRTFLLARIEPMSSDPHLTSGLRTRMADLNLIHERFDMFAMCIKPAFPQASQLSFRYLGHLRCTFIRDLFNEILLKRYKDTKKAQHLLKFKPITSWFQGACITTVLQPNPI